MINWINIINKNVKDKTDYEIKKLLKTAKAANLLGDEIFTISLDMLIEFCYDNDNNKEIKMVNEKTLKLLPGYRKTDWIDFFEIKEVQQKISEIQQKMLNFNKNATMVNATNTGDIKNIKDIVTVQNKSNEKQEQKFIYTNVESLFEEYKEPLTHICENCNFEFLCKKTFVKLN